MDFKPPNARSLLLVGSLVGCIQATTLPAQVARDSARAPTTHSVRWYEGAAAMTGASALMLLDKPVQRFAQDHRSSTSDDVAKVVRRVGEPEVYLTMSIGVLGVGALAHNPVVMRAGARMFASLGLAGSSTLMLKWAIGRARPNSDIGAFEFEPFGRNDAMPSGHTTMAFALATSLADDLRSTWADVGLYTLATGTAWSRINDNKHWLSDTGFGALIGITSAKLIDRRWQVFGITPPGFLLAPNGASSVGWHLRF